MAAPVNDPWHLVAAHRYADAVAGYDAELAKQPDFAAYMANRATALLCMDRYDEALAGFRQAGRSAQRTYSGTGYAENIAAIQWMLGDKAAAIATVRAAVDGLDKGTINYADLPGGASTGLLLWYFGVSARDTPSVERARAFLRKLANDSSIAYWPGPLALFVLDELMFEDALTAEFKTATVGQIIRRAESDVLTQRNLIEALFYQGTKFRSLDDETRCREIMEQCANIRNPFIEIEWYLARNEIGKNMQTAHRRSKLGNLLNRLIGR